MDQANSRLLESSRPRPSEELVGFEEESGVKWVRGNSGSTAIVVQTISKRTCSLVQIYEG